MSDPFARWNALFELKGTTKMRKTAVADFEGGFGDVATACGDEVRSAVDAGAADPEHERGAGHLGEGAAEVVRAATHGGGEGFELVRLVEVLDEMGFDSLDPIVSGAFRPRDEIDGCGGGMAVGSEEFAQEEVGEAGFVEQ